MSKQQIIHYYYEKPGTACDHCGTYIKHVYVCEDTDKSTFKVGSVCAEKIGGKELLAQAKNYRKLIERNERDRQLQQANAERQQAEQARRAEQEAENAKELEQALENGKSLPHPNKYFASKGKTMTDYLQYWIDQRGETSSKVMHTAYQINRE